MPIYSMRNTWGGNEISHDLFQYLEANLPEGKTILELGSGWGTSQLMRKWNVWSIENNEEWHCKFNGHQSRLVPLVDGWYDPEILGNFLTNLEYDLLLVDGPYDNREGLIKHFGLFNPNVPIVFDDVRRDAGKAIAYSIAVLADRPYTSYNDVFGVV